MNTRHPSRIDHSLCALESELRALLERRILMLDGAMGTMIQRYRLSEADFRGTRFADHTIDLRGNNDLLSLTQPHVVREIHHANRPFSTEVVGREPRMVLPGPYRYQDECRQAPTAEGHGYDPANRGIHRPEAKPQDGESKHGDMDQAAHGLRW